MAQQTEDIAEFISYKNQHGFPPTICIQLLNWCNLSCSYCRSDSSPHSDGELSYKKLENFLLSVKKHGDWRISLTGGEPFYWKDLNELLVLLDKLDFPFSITTNGFATIKIFEQMDSAVWKKCRLYVSIDGDQKTHDGFRGKNSYNNAIEFLKYARPKVNELFVNTVLFTNPKIWATDLYQEINSIGVNNWTIISPVQQGRWPANLDLDSTFMQQYDLIQEIAKGNTTTTYLNFAKTDQILTDVVFIDSDGSVRLPGHFKTSSNEYSRLSYKVNLADEDLVLRVVNSVNEFIKTNNYIL